MVPAVQDFVEAQLGRKFVEPPTFDLKACHADSTPITPLIFVLSAGSDPTAALLQFAAEKDMSSRSAPWLLLLVCACLTCAACQAHNVSLPVSPYQLACLHLLEAQCMLVLRSSSQHAQIRTRAS